MNKENILFGLVGLLLGCMVGFIFANSVNKGTIGAPAAGAQAVAGQNQQLPPGHPAIDPNAQANMMNMPEVQAALKLAQDQPQNFEAQMKAAELFYEIQQFDKAIEFLTKANKLQPENYDVIVTLGNANFDAEHYQDAERWYAAALTKKADDVNVRTDLGLTFLFRQPPDVDRAIREFRTSLERDPQHKQTLQNLVVALTKKGDAAEAEATLNKLAALDPQNAAISKLRTDIETLRSTGAKPATGRS